MYGGIMSRTLINDIVLLTREGWRPYGAQPAGVVYERLRCEHVLKGRTGRPYWFVRGDVFCCVGCAVRCSLVRPVGFSLPLPIKYPQPDAPYALTPQEMVTRKALLRVDEAAYCLNVSDRKVRNWVDEGRLVALKINPVRIKAESVAAMMRDFDE